jgi:hypothetical protein
MVVKNDGAFVEAASVPRVGKLEQLIIEMMTELVAERAQECSIGCDFVACEDSTNLRCESLRPEYNCQPPLPNKYDKSQIIRKNRSLWAGEILKVLLPEVRLHASQILEIS